MKGFKQFSIIILAMLLFLFPGCAIPVPEKDGTCSIVISRGEGFECLSPVSKISRGENATFTILLSEGYEIDGVDYPDYKLYPQSDGKVQLELIRVRYSVTVEINTRPAETKHIVTICKDAAFSLPEYEKRAADGQSVTFEFNFNGSYTFGGFKERVLYDEVGRDSEAENGVRRVTVTVKNVTQSATLTVLTVPEGEKEIDGINSAIRYDANGGEVKDGGKSFSVGFEKREDRRPNTQLGIDRISRENFVLIGWNTRSDGKGTHIGLGSRYPANDGKNLLYAEWSEYTPESSFDYSLVDRARLGELYAKENKKTLAELSSECVSDDKVAVITEYTGEFEKVTIPAALGGYPVLGIEREAFSVERQLKTVIFPDTIEYVAGLAFLYCDNLTEVYLSDNIVSFSETAFGYSPNVSTLHINAVLPPAYVNTENGQLANKIEMLVLNKSTKPKLLFFGGCSVWYGLNTRIIDEALNGKYAVFNTGVIGGVCALYQIDLISKYISKGDVFVHNPELGAVHQLLMYVDLDSRVFTTLESNYDLISELDLNRYTSVWKGFSKYLSGKLVYMSSEDYKPGNYDDGLDYLDSHGNYDMYREGGYDNDGLSFEIISAAEAEQFGSAKKLADCYTELKALGARVLLGFAPVYSDGLDYRRGVELCEYLQNHLSSDVSVYMNFSDCVMDKEYFYDTSYHLSTSGAELYSHRVATLIKEAL